MKQTLSLFLLFMLCLLPAAAKDKDEVSVECFAEVQAQSADIVIGDSTLLTVVLYSSAPVNTVETKKEPSVKRAHLRALRFNPNATVRRVVRDGRRYYSMVVAQYVLATERLGKLKVSACEYEATFLFRKSTGNPFEEFFGYGGETISVKKKVKAEAIELTVKEKPKRTMEEMKHDGLL